MEIIRPDVKIAENIAGTIWLYQLYTEKAHECKKRPTVVIFKHQQNFRVLIILFSLELSTALIAHLCRKWPTAIMGKAA